VSTPGPDGAGRLRVLALGIGSVALVWAAITWLPLWGSVLGMVKGLIILAVEVALAVFLARGLGPRQDRIANLALTAPVSMPRVSLVIAVLSALVLVGVAKLALQFVPATSEAPIQTFVSWPSGMLSFAALGVIVPLGEEIFFRGFLYRAALALGTGFAFGITLSLFVAVHAPQTWGNWGGLTALLITGAVLTGLRAWSGSALPPALAHLLYNLFLSMESF
jgi:membrane protease YdiL (CAAX protease family)